MNSHEVQERLLSFLMDLKIINSKNVSLKITPFNEGQSNPTFLLTIRFEKILFLVLRKKPLKPFSIMAHRVDREYRVIKAIEKSSVPVPKLICFCDDKNIIGTEFYLMEYVKGRIFHSPSYPAKNKLMYWEESIRILAKLHTINVWDVGLDDYGKTTNFYNRQVNALFKTLKSQEKAKNVPSFPNLNHLIDWYLKNFPLKDSEKYYCTVHGDYKMDNLVFYTEKPSILAVLDWELSTLGDPISDLVNLLLPFTFPMFFIEFLGIKEEFPDCLNDLVKYYCQLTKRTFPIPSWKFYLSFGYFRLAVILHGVLARFSQGDASSSLAKKYGSLAVTAFNEAEKWAFSAFPAKF